MDSHTIHMILIMSSIVGYKVPVAMNRENQPLIAHPHLLVQATSERFLPAWGTFRVGLASESHWLQPVLILTIHW
jgi:hypothetical protein